MRRYCSLKSKQEPEPKAIVSKPEPEHEPEGKAGESKIDSTEAILRKCGLLSESEADGASVDAVTEEGDAPPALEEGAPPPRRAFVSEYTLSAVLSICTIV